MTVHIKSSVRKKVAQLKKIINLYERLSYQLTFLHWYL